MTDPIADMLTRIRNAKAVSKPSVSLPYSKIKMDIANVLKKEGFIADCEKKGKTIKKTIELTLKYGKDGHSYITDLKRISKPGQRIYKGSQILYPVKQGFGIAILSTPSGVMSSKEAKKKNVGGEILCEVW